MSRLPVGPRVSVLRPPFGVQRTPANVVYQKRMDSHMSNYSKHKERRPEDTVLEIQRILNSLGLFPVGEWLDSSCEGARTVRFSLYPTALGTNGKGTDEVYASASGLAEMMERLSNGLLTIRDKLDSFQGETGFVEFPDEAERSISEILRDPDPFTESTMQALGLNDPFSQSRLLKMIALLYGPEGNNLITVPFVDPFRHKTWWVPLQLAHATTGSNGMAAGNTLEEAMVQGLSEIFERAVNRELVSGSAVPPEIPDEALRPYSFYPLLEQLRAEGKYRVTLYDCSLGKGYPVTAICIANLETGLFGMKLGAHPSFAVAIERTLTEALQGRNIEAFTAICRAGTPEEADIFHNYPNVYKTGNGVYPLTLFTEEPGWEFRPWDRWEGLDNHGMLKGMLELLREEGYEPLFRDTSFLGFPSCYILVPTLSETYRLNKTFLHVINTNTRIMPTWKHFPKLSDEEEERLLRYIRFKEYSILENTVTILTQRPLSEAYSPFRIGAWLALKRGDFALSKHYFRVLCMYESDPDEATYLRAMAQYASLRGKGCDACQVRALVQRQFSEDIAARVCADTEDEQGMLERQFRPLSCYDCEHCEVAGTECDYPNVRRILVSAAKGMRAENVSQEALLERLESLCEEPA